MSSRTRPRWDADPEPPDQLGGPTLLEFPDDWTLSTAWQRAQRERDAGGPVNDAERIVALSDGQGVHRVAFALQGTALIADCDCRGHEFNAGWCAHVASCWWQWTRGDLDVVHLDTGRVYQAPPSWLEFGEAADPAAFSDLTPAQLDAYLACDLGDAGVREYARFRDVSKGTISNLLSRARETVAGGGVA